MGDEGWRVEPGGWLIDNTYLGVGYTKSDLELPVFGQDRNL